MIFWFFFEISKIREKVDFSKKDTFWCNYMSIKATTDLGTEHTIGQRKDGAEKFFTPRTPPAGCTPRKWGMKLSNLKNTDLKGGFWPIFFRSTDSLMSPLYNTMLSIWAIVYNKRIFCMLRHKPPFFHFWSGKLLILHRNRDSHIN